MGKSQHKAPCILVVLENRSIHTFTKHTSQHTHPTHHPNYDKATDNTTSNMSDNKTTKLSSAVDSPKPLASSPGEKRADSRYTSMHEEVETRKDATDAASDKDDGDAAAAVAAADAKTLLKQQQQASIRAYQRVLSCHQALCCQQIVRDAERGSIDLARPHLVARTEREALGLMIAARSTRPMVGNYPVAPASHAIPSTRVQGLLSSLSRLTIEPEPAKPVRPDWWIGEDELAGVSPYVANFTRDIQLMQLEADARGMDTWDYLQQVAAEQKGEEQ